MARFIDSNRTYFFQLAFKEKAVDGSPQSHHIHKSAAEEEACLQSMRSKKGETRPRVLHLLPECFAGPCSDEGLRDVAVEDVIEGLCDATMEFDQRQADYLVNDQFTTWKGSIICAKRRHFLALACRMLEISNNAGRNLKSTFHSSNLPSCPAQFPTPTHSPPPSLTLFRVSSLTGMTAAAPLYLHTVLEHLNGGYPVNMTLHVMVLTILRRDCMQCANRHLHSRNNGTLSSRDFWFWRVFVGAFALAKAIEVALATVAGVLDINAERENRVRVDELQDLQFTFDGLIQRWSKVSGVSDWYTARKVLSWVAWPRVGPNQKVAEAIWWRAKNWPQYATDNMENQ